MGKSSSPDRRRGLLGFLGLAALAVGLTVAAVPAHAAVPTATHVAGPATHVAGPQVRHSAETCTPVTPTDIWSGYEACGSAYTSVTATWTQPAVSCTSTGTVGFWVGLGGIGGSTLVQTGINVSCSTGTPQYTGFWEVPPAAATNYDEPVYPGDTIIATVVSEGGDSYSLQLTDATRDWSESTPVTTTTAAGDSAEVIVEAVTVGSQITVVPNFTAVQFTNTAIDGESLSAATAQPVQLDNSAGQVECWPAGLSGSGFTDFYAGWVGSSVAAALTGSNGYLYTYSGPGLADTFEPMQLGTSPGITLLSNGTYEIAYQSTSGDLTLFNSGSITNTGLPMKSGTSPAIAAQAGGGYQVAYQSSTGSLWTYSPSTGAVNQSQGMLAGTSPAITGLASGGYEMAIQANTGILIVYGSGGDINTGLGMKTGTSPSISAAGGGFEAAMQANTGVLWTYGTNGTVDLGLGMAGGTSPAITGLTTGGYEIAFQTNTGVLEVYGQAGDLNTGIGMLAGASPSITVEAGGGYETAFKENTGYFTLWGTVGDVQTNLVPDSGTNPSIAG
jgi:hypothetical protein